MATSETTPMKDYEKHLQRTWDEIREHRDALNLLEGLLIMPATLQQYTSKENEQLWQAIDGLTTLIDEALVSGVTPDWRTRYHALHEHIQEIGQ